MKRGMHLLLALGLAFSCVGCAGEAKKDDAKKPEASDTSAAGSADTSANATGTPPIADDFTLVNLKVPNMT